MKALVTVLVTVVPLYLAFLLGQVTMKRKVRDRRDPLPVFQAARTLLIERKVNGNGGVSDAIATRLEMALDEWDLKAS